MSAQKKPNYQVYPSDLSNKKWKIIQAYLPKPKKEAGKAGRNPVDLRLVVNAIRYITRGGISWAMLPKEYGSPKTVYGYFSTWNKIGLWRDMNAALVQRVRTKTKKPKEKGQKKAEFRKKRPTAASLDSQSVKTTQIGGEARGYDGGKKIKGRKRFILVDTLGLLLCVAVLSAQISEQAGAKFLVEQTQAHDTIKHLTGKLKLVWVDGGYQKIAQWVQGLVDWVWQMVKRSDDTSGFELLPRRWVVERTFGWLNNYRRLSKDYEKTTLSAEGFIYIAHINICLNRL